MSAGVAATGTGIVLIAHGTVESLDDLPEFLANIRRGHPAPPELLAEVRRRYEAIGGRSPLLDVTREVARKLEARVALPVRVAMRLFRPYPREVLAEMAREGVTRVLVIPLAQHSAHVYAAAVREAAAEVPGIREVLAAPNWGRTPELTRAFANVIDEALAKIPEDERDQTALVLTAHSLPLSVIEAGDPYERELRASAADVAAAVRGRFARSAVAFQSQGMGTGPGGRPMAWLGPDLKATLETLAQAGMRHVVVAPIGFLADHVEILYDLDIEAKAWANELSIVLHRSTSLNASDGLISALVSVATELGGGG
jgi:protoporphyrin/coproporphyrin ferrochelatase